MNGVILSSISFSNGTSYVIVMKILEIRIVHIKQNMFTQRKATF